MKKKRCFKCKEKKVLSEFYKHKEMSDGHLGKCKACAKKDVSGNYRSNIDHYKEYEQKRSKTSGRKKNALEYQKTRRAKSPEKYKARTAVGNALRDKRLKKKPCETCGEEKAQAHHEDYSKPLDVRWLCFKHHRAHHGQIIGE